ncbi:MAG TPA: hypothetical protein VKD72_29135, partial [Gemmataceae bacterium]|nr:hypothetical protein [Gemmataceae bacterium]
MSIRTLLLYLIGDRQAILTIAGDRRALWVGLMFVLSAGFAREYDGQDLLHEPWHVLLPLGASLLISFLLFTYLYWEVTPKGGTRPRFFTAYRSFLALFWMTAPVAWLYAVPYERFLSPSGATTANLLTLGIVAVWRVTLMVRVASVLMGYPTWTAFFRVMLFADVVTILAYVFVVLPLLLPFMAGVRIPEGQLLAMSITNNVATSAFVSLPFWIIGYLWTNSRGARWTWQLPQEAHDRVSPSSRGIWALGFSSLAIWVFVLPWTQPEQMLRHRVETDLKAGRIAEALETMSAHTPADFPPFWEPPLWISLLYFQPHIMDVMPVVVEKPPAPWVREHFLRKFGEFLEYYGLRSPRGGDGTEVVQILSQLPEGPALAAEHQARIRETMEYS